MTRRAWLAPAVLVVALLAAWRALLPDGATPAHDADARAALATRADGRPAPAMDLDALASDGDARVATALAPPAPDGLPAKTDASARPTPPADPGLALAGLVIDPRGRPVADVRIDASHALGRRRTTTDAQGRFLLEGLTDAEGWLLVAHDAFAIAVAEPVRPGRDPVPEVEVALEPPLALAGRLVDAEGRPASGVELEVRGARLVAGFPVLPGLLPTWELLHGTSHVRTDGEGAFRFERLFRGAFDVLAHVSGAHAYEQRVGEQLAAGREDLLLVLDPERLGGVSLRGTVVDDASDAPVDAFVVTPFRTSGNGGGVGTRHPFAHTGGRFAISGLDPGRLEIRIEAEGWVPRTVPAVDYAAGVHEFDVRLARPRSVTVQTVDERGAPLAKAVLRLVDADGREVTTSAVIELPAEPGHAPARVRSWNRSVETGPDGRVRLEDLPVAALALLAHHPDAPRGVDERFELDLRAPVDDVRTLVLRSSWTPGDDFIELHLRLAVADAELTLGWEEACDDPLRAVEVEGMFRSGAIRALDVQAFVTLDCGDGLLGDTIFVTPRDDGRFDVRSTREGAWVVDDPELLLRLPRRETHVRVHGNERVGSFFTIAADASVARRVALLGE